MNKNLFSVRLALILFALPVFACGVVSAKMLLSDGLLEQPLVGQLADSMVEDSIEAYRGHVLAADSSGNFSGRVLQFEGNAGGLKVFFVRNGEIEQSTVTDAEGHFEVTDLTAGPYSFVAAGQNGFVAHGTYVTTDAEVAGPPVIAMHTAAIAPTYESITAFVADHAATNGAFVDTTVPVDSLAISGIDGGNRIQITKDGKLVGRVVALAQRTDQSALYGPIVAQLINENQEVREVLVDENGKFTVNDIEPGVYDFVAAGEQGFAAIGLEAVAFPEVTDNRAETPSQNTGYAGTVQDFCCDGCHSQLDVCMTAPVDCGVVYEQIEYAVECCCEEIVYDELIAIDDVGCGCATGCNMGCGGFQDYGGCCGGGGGGSGGLNIGDLVGAALAAWILTEVVDRIDNNVTRQPVVVPPVVVPPPTSPF